MSTQALLDAGQLAAAVMAIVSLIAGSWWLARRVVHIADAVNELVPTNGGSSIKDQITRIEQQLKDHVGDGHHHRTEEVMHG